MIDNPSSPSDTDTDTQPDATQDLTGIPPEPLEDDDEDDLSLEDADRPVKIKDTPLKKVASFEEAGLHPKLREAVASLGWTTPTEIQSFCLPYTLQNRDLAGFAQTGTGKTGVFLITCANKILQARDKGADIPQPSCVILTPTRELAMQVEQDAAGLFENLQIKSLAVFGGVDYEKQARALREGVDVIVATPGRLKDYTKKKVFSLASCQLFVCDEADRMFDMGFIEDIEFFFSRVPENAQKLMFSATTNDSVKELAFEYLNKPEYISATPESITPDRIQQHAVICEARNKLKVMLGLLQDHQPTCSIIFTNTKIAAEWLHYKLQGNGLDTDLITGDLPQRKRISLIQRIKLGQVKALIATDVASRGLHIADVTHVYNFDLPDDASNYVHRIGRTARAGAVGFAYSLVCEDYGDNLKAINELLGEDLALKAGWFDERYLAIEDKAGDPLADKSSRLGRAMEKSSSGRSGGGARSGGRTGGAGRAGGQESGKGPKTMRAPRKTARDGDGGDQRGRGGQDRNRPKQTGPSGRGGQDRDQGQRRRRTNRKRGGQGQGQQRRDQPQQRQAARSPQEMTVAKSDQSVGSIMKKFLKTIFGRKD